MRALVLLLTLWSLAACSGRPEGESVTAPEVDFLCDPFQSVHCEASGTGTPVFIGLSSDLNFQCESELDRLIPSLLVPSFTYAGWTTAIFADGVLQGVVTQWVNSSYAKMLDFENRTYKVCAFLDVNDNGSLDPGEVLAEDNLDVGSNFYPISAWVQL